MRKPNNPFKLTISLLTASLLAACGGGGDSGASAPASTPLNNNGELEVNNPTPNLGRETVVTPGTGNNSPTNVQGNNSKNSGNQPASQQGNQQGNQSGTQPTTSQPTTSDSKSSSDGNSSPSKPLNPDDTSAGALEEDQELPTLELPDLESKERADAETEKAEETKEAPLTDKTVAPEDPSESTQGSDSVSTIESPELEPVNKENTPTEDPQSANVGNQSRGNESESREENGSSQANPSESGAPVTTTPAPKPETPEAKSEQKEGLQVRNEGVNSLEIKSLRSNNYRGSTSSESSSAVNWKNASDNHKTGQEQLNRWVNPVASSFSFDSWWSQVEKWYKRGTADLTLEKAKDHSERFNLENALLSGRKPQITEDVEFLPYLSQTSSLIQHRESEQSASRTRKPKSTSAKSPTVYPYRSLSEILKVKDSVKTPSKHLQYNSTSNTALIDGSGVSVAVMDTAWTDVYTNKFNHKPLVINHKDKTSSTSGTKELVSTHGEKISLIIGDKTYGIAPGIKLNYVEHNEDKIGSLLTYLQEADSLTKAVNISFGALPDFVKISTVSNLKASIKTSDSDIDDLVSFAKTNNRNRNSRFAPLIVQAIGNVRGKHEYYTTYGLPNSTNISISPKTISSNKSSTSEAVQPKSQGTKSEPRANKSSSGLPESAKSSFDYNPGVYSTTEKLAYFGKFIEPHFFEDRITKAEFIGDSWIEVMGYTYDSTDEYAKTLDYWWSLHRQYTDEVVSSNPDEVFTELNKQYDSKNSLSDLNYAANTDDHFYPSLESHLCGSAMYSCVAAPFVYGMPDYGVNRDKATELKGDAKADYVVDEWVNNANDASTAKTTVKPKYLKYAEDKYAIDGTSFSAPQVVAIAALVSQNFPWMQGPELKTTILTTATDIGPKGIDPVFGWGAVNLEQALKGPAQFYARDFNADMLTYEYTPNDRNKGTQLSPKGGMYFFSNNISGDYGLKVSGKPNDWLFLVGEKNTYKGDTVINNGNLVVTKAANVGISRNTYVNANNGSNRVTLGSAVYVNRTYDGWSSSFYALDAELNTVTNNAYTELKNVTLNSYEGKDGSILGLYVPTQSSETKVSKSETDKYNVFAENNFTLGSNTKLKLYVPEASSGADLSIGKKFVLVQVGDAGSLSGSFAEAYADKPLYDVSIVTDTGNKQIQAVFDRKATADLVKAGTLSTRAVQLANSDSSTSGADSFIDERSTMATFDEKIMMVGAGNLDAVLKADSSVQTPRYVSSSVEAEDAETGNVEPAIQLATLSSSLASGESETELVTKAGDLTALTANLGVAELSQLVYSQAGTTYANLQQATLSHSQKLNSDFRDTVNRFATNDEAVHVYGSFAWDKTNWSLSGSAIKGKATTNDFMVGVYQQFDLSDLSSKLNWGVALNQGLTSWTETVSGVNFGEGKAKTTGLHLSLGLADVDKAYNLGLSLNRYAYDLDLLAFKTQHKTANFNAWSTSLGYDYTLALYQTDSLKLSSTLGTEVHYYHQGAFAETLVQANPTLTPLLFNAKSSSNWGLSGKAGLQLDYLTQVGDLRLLWNAGIKVQLNTSSDLNLKLANGRKTALGFSQRFLTELNLGSTLKISDDFQIKLSGNFTKSSATHSRNLKLTADYRF